MPVPTRTSIGTLATLGLIVLAGSALRLHDLDKRTITHVEMYVPGIDLPEHHSEPGRRVTLGAVFSTMMDSQEPHPPAYYVVMLGWTKLFGTSLWAMRLPSVLLGIGSIILVYLLAALERDQRTALLSAAVLALHGHHIFWSQIAKMYGPGVFLGLLSTVALLLITRRSGRKRSLPWLYAVSTLLGLSTTIYVWPIFATHILWASTLYWTRTAALRGVIRLQALIFAVATPLCALAAFQSRRPSYLPTNPLPDVGEFLQFGFLFEPDSFSPSPVGSPVAWGVVFAFAVLLVGCGLSTRREPAEGPAPIPLGGPSPAWIALASAVSLVSIAWFALYVREVAPQVLGRVIATLALPVLVTVAALVAWRRSPGRESETVLVPTTGRHRGSISLGSLLAVLPLSMAAAVSLAVPLLASRAAILWTPYLVVVLAGGATALVRRARPWVVILPALAIVLAMGIGHYKRHLGEFPVDYKTLSRRWIPLLEDSDLIFIREHYRTTPIYYYLKGNRFRFVGSDYAAEIHNHPRARVWVLTTSGMPITSEMDDALRRSGYAPQDALDERRIRATLFTELRRPE